MLYFCVIITFILLNVICDINYFARTLFTVLIGRLYQSTISITEVTTIYGVCTLRDCDVVLKYIRLDRLVRELDFARYHFYDRTGIYRRSQQYGIKSLQGCTLTITSNPVPTFQAYRINTKLVYWDDRSLFFEHEVVTLRDGKTRHHLVSRQHALGAMGDTVATLLRGIPGADSTPNCPNYIQCWLRGMEISSKRLREVDRKQIL